MTITEAATNFDQNKAEAFAGQMVSVINQGALSLMTSIGHRLGLFDAMADQPPATSQQIAKAANLNERYVREWLSAMATGRIVDYNPTNQTFHLPAEHAMWLTRNAGVNNLANATQVIPMLAHVEDHLVGCFRNGGGVPYSANPHFHRVMADMSNVRNDQLLINRILPLAPGLVDRLLEGIEALEIGCGRGHALNLMAKAFPRSHFVGYDLSEEAIAYAKEEAGTLGLTHVSFKEFDAGRLNHVEQFDLVAAFDAIHDQARPDVVLRGIATALRPDGIFLMQEIRAATPLAENMDHMAGPFLYTVSTTHCMTVSLSQNGMGLGTMWGRQQAEKMLEDAGFKKVEVKQVPEDLFNDYYLARKR